MKYKNVISTSFYLCLLAIIGLSSMAFVACQESKIGDSNNEKVLVDSNVTSSKNLKLIAELNVKIKETSGLALIGDVLITHNDKGRSNDLMLIDPENGKIVQTISASNIQNNDWYYCYQWQ